MRNVVFLLFIFLSFNSYSQIGEYISLFYIYGEPSNKSPGGSLYEEYTYLNVKEDHTFKIIITNYSSNNEENNCCLKIEGTWVKRDIFLYLEDKENKKIYYLIINNDRLIDVNLYRLYEVVDAERAYTIKDEEIDSYLEELSFPDEFRKINNDSELDNFERYKEQLCR